MNKFWHHLKKLNFLSSTVTLKLTGRGILTALILIAAAILLFSSKFPLRIAPPKQTQGPPQEITQIKVTQDLKQQVVLYKKLIDRVGPVAAQDDLEVSGLPFTGQTHLLNHTVGEYLYQKEGVSGLKDCREYFLASCYHGFILNAIAVGGIPEVVKVMETCKQEGINTVYPQCAHAVGHGFLAFIGYKNLTKALTMCDSMTQNIADFPSFNCQDGVFMENIWALHDGNGPSPDRWVKDSDPVYPCDDKRIDSKYLLACWSNQPSLMYQQFRGDLKKVADQCAKITPANLEDMCYNGLSRQIHPIAAGSLDKTFQLCSLLGGQWTDYCININDTASFSVGDRSLPFAICEKIDAAGKDQCYQGLVGMINAYAKSPDEHSSWCDKVTDSTWQERCKNSNR